MAYAKSKGLIAIATEYKNKSYGFTNLTGYIGANNATSTPDQVQDLDSYRNANGKLKRFVLDHTASKIEFNTPYLTYEQKCDLISAIKLGISLNDGVCNKKQRKCCVRYYDDWEDDYKYGFFYVPDVDFQYYGILKGKPIYQPIRIAFIEY